MLARRYCSAQPCDAPTHPRLANDDGGVHHLPDSLNPAAPGAGGGGAAGPSPPAEVIPTDEAGPSAEALLLAQSEVNEFEMVG